jgi:holo-[acyl-carrier protein] synthase
MKRLREKFGDDALKKAFTDTEIEKCLSSRKPDQMLAGRFAAKEAVMKALGSGLFQEVHFKQIEVSGGGMEAPEAVLSNHAKEIADSLGVRKIFISITHEKDYAAAVAVLES